MPESVQRTYIDAVDPYSGYSGKAAVGYYHTLRPVLKDCLPGDDQVFPLLYSDDEKIIFSAASLVEPGSFDLANIKDQEIPGISLFLVLPGPMEGAEAFDLMMSTARALAQSLDAELLDESGSTLSIQRERYLREEIIQYEHSAGVA